MFSHASCEKDSTRECAFLHLRQKFKLKYLASDLSRRQEDKIHKLESQLRLQALEVCCHL